MLQAMLHCWRLGLRIRLAFCGPRCGGARSRSNMLPAHRAFTAQMTRLRRRKAARTTLRLLPAAIIPAAAALRLTAAPAATLLPRPGGCSCGRLLAHSRLPAYLCLLAHTDCTLYLRRGCSDKWLVSIGML